MPSKRSVQPFTVVERDAAREWLEEVLAPLPELSLRRLFGGAGIYSEEAIFGIWHQRRLYLKTNESTRPAFVTAGAGALRVRSGTVPTSYYEVPAVILDDEAELVRWARQALEVARQALEVAKKPRKREFIAPEAILAKHERAIVELAERVRALVKSEAPEATEAGYPGWQLIGYRAPHYFCFVSPQPGHVRLGFEHGHALPDPKGVLEPMGKRVRFVRLEPGKRIPVAALRALIQAALVAPARARRTPPRRSKKKRGDSSP